jgi:two-component system, OmpR family, KDP operon response regulator KdpE
MPTVLLIEDDPALAAMYAAGLRSHGYKVTHVATATAAVREGAESSPELAVIDIGLPDGSGIDVLTSLARAPGIPPLVAVVFTNFDDPALMASAIMRGAAAYLIKADTTPARLATILGQLAPN